jgi:WD40 repeat protein
VTTPASKLDPAHRRHLQASLREAVRGLGRGRWLTRELTPARLLAVLCGTTVSPFIAAGFAAGVPGAEVVAITGTLSSIGTGVLSAVLVSAADRLRPAEAATPSVPEVENRIIEHLDTELTSGPRAEALRRDITEFFSVIGAGGIVAEASIEADDVTAFAELVAALGRFGQDFLEARDVLLDGIYELTVIRRDIGQLSAEIGEIAEILDQVFTRELSARSATSGRRKIRWTRACPYRGLRPFGERDAMIFYGREKMTDDLAGRIMDHQRIVIVTGSSGAGKTSLLQAGLMPMLRRGRQVPVSGRWPCLVRTPGEEPLKQLAQAIATLGARNWREIWAELEAQPEEANILVQQALDRYLEQRGRATADDHVVLIVDQFEDVFISGASTDKAAAFIAALFSAATVPVARGAQPPAQVVIAVRADYLNQCFNLRELHDATERLFVVHSMENLDFRRAITDPATAAGLGFEDGLVDLILGDVHGTRPDGALPLLSEALRLTWERRVDNQLTKDGYSYSGGVGGAVRLSAEAVYADLSDEQKDIGKDILLSMTSEDGQQTRETNIVALGASYPRHEVDVVLNKLASGRLIVIREQRAQIVHEALLTAWPRLREWLDEDVLNHNVHLKLRNDAARWAESGKEAAYLYRGPQLVTWLRAASEWLTDRHKLSQEEEAFLRASERAARIAARRRVLAIVLSVVVVIAVAGVLVARQHAVTAASQQRALGYAGQLSVISEQQDQQDPVTAAQLAAAASVEAPTSAQAEESMLQVLAQPVRGVFAAGGPIRATAFSPAHGGILVTAGEAIICYSLATSRRVGSPISVPGGADGVAVTSAGTVLATAGADGTARLWDLATGREIGEPMRASSHGGVNAVAFSPDGTVLATADGDGTARLWDVATDSEIGRPLTDGGSAAPGTAMNDVAFDPDGKILATASLDGTARLWDVGTQRQIGAPMADVISPLPGEYEMLAVAFDPRGDILATANEDGAVGLWKVATQRRIRPPFEVAGANDVAFSPGGQTLAVAEYGGVTTLWDLATRTQIAPSLASTADGATVAAVFSPGGTLLATVSGDGLARLWDLTRFRAITATADVGALQGMAFSPDGRVVATIGIDLGVRLWDLDGGNRPAATIPAALTHGASALALDQDDQILAIGSLDGAVRLWSLNPVRELGGPIVASHDSEVSAVAFSPDGKLMVTGDANGAVRLWDARTGKPVGALATGGTAGVSSLVFSPGGGTLAAVTDGSMRLWDMTSRQRLSDPVPLAVKVDAVAFSPDGQTLATAGDNGTALLWNLDSGLQVGTPMVVTAIAGVTDVAFSPDGQLLATAGEDGDARLWDVRTQRQIGPSIVAGSAASGLDAVAFSSDGADLATVAADGSATMWGVGFPDNLFVATCQLAGRSLTKQEWNTYMPSAPYNKGCPSG